MGRTRIGNWRPSLCIHRRTEANEVATTRRRDHDHCRRRNCSQSMFSMSANLNQIETSLQYNSVVVWMSTRLDIVSHMHLRSHDHWARGTART